MIDSQIRALFAQIADAEPGTSRVDGQLALRRGRARLRWRRACMTGGSVLATAGVIVASLTVSGAILRGTAGTGPANSSGVLARVPRYFVAIRGHAVVGATATGNPECGRGLNADHPSPELCWGPACHPSQIRSSCGWEPLVTTGRSSLPPHPDGAHAR